MLDITALGLICVKLVVSLYLISSVLAGYDGRALKIQDIIIRLVLAFLILLSYQTISFAAFFMALAVVIIHHLQVKRQAVAASP